MVRHDRLHALAFAEPDDPGKVGRLIVGEPVQGDDRFQSEQPDVLDVFGEVGQAAVGRRAAVISDGLGRGHDDHARRVQAGQATLDVKEFLRAEVGGKTGLGHDAIRQLEGQAGGHGGVGALGDVGEGAAVHEGRRAFERLHEVRMDGVAQQHLHCAHRLHLFGADRLAAVGEAHHHVGHALAEVAVVLRHAEDGHDLRGGG